MTYPIDFLTKLSIQRHQTKYVRIIALSLDEKPRESIEGVITGGGPISIDGASAVRRTCSLQMSAKRGTIVTDPYWALTNKFKIEIGLQNNIDSLYPDIIWMNQGIYVINQFSSSENATSINISISGQDKMSKLNGIMGGIFPVQTTLDTIEEVAKDGRITYVKQPIHFIIRNMLHELAGEPYQNIIIEDLPAYGYELWNYMGTSSQGEEMPMYLFRSANDNKIKNMTIDENKKVYNDDKEFLLKDLNEAMFYNKINNTIEIGDDFTLSSSSSKYKIQKINYGDIAGYHRTALVYPGDLIAKVGETITSVLDNIKNLLGEFEYFYDLDGRFIFRKKKTYVNGLFSPINGDTIEPFVEVSQYAYEFSDRELLASISFSPSIGEVKNDFTIWGNKRSSTNGDKLPIHARFAIDKKPEKYTTFPFYKKCFDMSYVIIHPLYQNTNEDGYLILSSQDDNLNNAFIEDWEETTSFEVNGYFVTYTDSTERVKNIKPENALDFEYVYKEGKYQKATEEEIKDELCPKFYLEVSPIELKNSELYTFNEDKTEAILYQNQREFYLKENNLFVLLESQRPANLDETYYLKENITTYYSEWCKETPKEEWKLEDWRELIYLMARDYYQHNQDPNYNIKLKKNNQELAPLGKTGYEIYYADMQGFWRKLYNPEGSKEEFIKENDKEAVYKNWARSIIYHPESLDFWIDFLDTGGEIDKFAISQIGHRPKVEAGNNNAISAIFYKETPDVEFILPIEPGGKNPEDLDYSPIWIQDNMKQLFNISSRGKASNEYIDELIWKHACIAEGVNITCIPLYFLEPNTRIKLLGEDYIINKITLPITYNGTMQITASKVIRPI